MADKDFLVKNGLIVANGNIAVTGTVDGRDVAADGTKLDGIESGATADMTASEILTAIKTVDGASSGLDADLLDGQQGSYYLDWTNTTNKPDPNITVSLTGDVIGSANATLTDLANGSISITTDIANSGVTASTYGSASLVPIITVGADGRITAANTVSVAGVSNFVYTAANNTFVISTADGGNYPATVSALNGNLSVANLSVTTINRDPNITVSLTGDVTGSANTTLTNLANGSISIATTIASNSVALGTDTTGDYMVNVVGTANEIEVTHTQGEGSTATIGLPDSVTITSNLTVGGNLTVSGNTVTINATELAIEDNMIYLNEGSTVTNPDLGFAGNYNDGTYAHAGIFRDASDSGTWKFFQGYTLEPDANTFIDTTHASFALSNVQANTFIGALSGNATTATTLQTARTISLTGDVTGSASFDGGSNISIAATIASNSVALGTDTTGNYVASITNGSYITGANGGSESAALTLAVDATNLATASKVVARDASGNFSANTITAALSGNATTATTLQTARTIWGQSFNGSSNVTGNATFDDNVKAIFGAGSDLEIYHDGTHSYIVDNGTGNLKIRTQGDSIRLETIDGGRMVLGIKDAEVRLYYNDVEKFATTTTGVDVTGTVTATAFSGPLTGDVTGNATTASAWQTARTITLGGVLSGSVSIDGSSNVTLTAAHTSDPVITLTGAVTGSGTMTNLGSVSIATTATADPTLTLAGDATGSATFTNLGNATLTVAVVDDSHNHTGMLPRAEIPGSTDLNSYRTTGYYIQDSNADAASGSNYPAALAGILEVYNGDIGNGLQTHQEYYVYNDHRTYRRHYYNGTWGSWSLIWNSNTDGASSGLDADLLDGQHGSYYLDWTNVSNKPDPNIAITLTGAVTGTGNATLTDLANGSISITTTATSDPTLTLAGDATGSATFTNLGNATLTVAVVDDSHTHDGRYYTETESDARFLRRDLAGGSIDVNAANGTQLYIGSTGSWTNRGPVTDNSGALWSLNTHPGNYYSQFWFDTGGGSVYHRTSSNALPTGAWQRLFMDNYHPNADKWTTARTFALTGDVTGSVSVDGSGNVSMATTIAANSVALGTDTTGNYMVNVSAGGGISVSHTQGEGSTATVSHSDTSTQASLTALTGANVVSDIDLDTYGHVTALATRTMTAADLGAITGNQTITLSGDATGSGTTAITVTVVDDSHSHSFNNLINKTGGTGDYTTTGTMTAATFNATSTTNGGFQGIDADSLTAPSFTWTSDLNTGMWHRAADQIGFTAGGNDEFWITTTYTESAGSSRAPIFYDSNNTAYYTDPASTSRLNAVYGNGYYNGGLSYSQGPILTYTLTSGGSGYTNGTYTNQVLSGGSGVYATFDFTVAGGVVTVATLTERGSGFIVGNTITIPALGGTGSGGLITVDTVRTVDMSLYNSAARIRLSSNDTTLAANQEIGGIYFGARDASAGGAGDKAYILGVAAGTSGGGEIQFWTSSNGGSPTLCATVGGANDFRLYNTAGTFYHSFSNSPTANRTLTLPDATGTIALTSSSITGNAATATTLQTARTIGGVSFNGSANINLPGVNTTGNQDIVKTGTITLNATADIVFDATGNQIFWHDNGVQRAYFGVGASNTLSIYTGGTAFATDGTLNTSFTGANLVCSGNITASSDSRLKENIVTIESALSKVLNLRGVYFNKIGSSERNIGVIAQEVEAVIPEVVMIDTEGMKAVAYGNITGILIEAIKEQDDKINTMRNEIDELKNLVKQLMETR